jgi:hypothetical protein
MEDYSMKRALYEIAVLQHELDDNKEIDTNLVIEPEVILAKSPENARMYARLKAMEEDSLGPEDVDEFATNYEILVRPFK